MKSFFQIAVPVCLLLSPLAAAEPRPPAVSIESLVAELASGHPELLWYEAEVEAARAAARVAATRENPELSVEIGRKRVRDAAGGPGGDGTAWSVSVGQVFEWPGRMALRKAIASRDIALAEIGLAQFRAGLEARTRTLAYGLFAAQAAAEATAEVAERFRLLKETFLAREPGGVAPLLEARVIEAEELILQRRATGAELAIAAALAELNQLRGRPPGETLVVSRGTPVFAAPPPVEELLAAARQNHFGHRARQLELEQQGLSARLARHERYPDIEVAPFFAHESAGERESTAGVGFSVPLPVTRRAAARTELADVRLRQAEVAAHVAWRELELDVVTTSAAFAAHLGEMERWPPGGIEPFRAAAAAADRHHRLGAVPLGTYVELQRAYLEAVETLLATERDAIEAGLRLELLTGLTFNAVRITP